MEPRARLITGAQPRRYQSALRLIRSVRHDKMNGKSNILPFTALLLFAGCTTFCQPDMAVLSFDNSLLTVSVAGAERRYALPKPQDISTQETMPNTPGLQIIRFVPQMEKMGGEIVDVSTLHIRTADGHMIVLKRGQ